MLFEELLFTGALLYIAIRKFGMRAACIVSACAFGIYHWFSFGALGNPVLMTIVFLTTGFWGFMYGQAFAKTNSLSLPIGLHLGWNLLNIVVFSQGPLGSQFFIKSNEQKPEGIISLVIYLFQIFAVPVFVYFYLKRIKAPATN